MKGYFIGGIIGLALIGVAVFMAGNNVGMEYVSDGYTHKGNILLNDTQLEQFKYDIANNNSEVIQLDVINHTDYTLVVFEFESDVDLGYGNVIENVHTEGFGQYVIILFFIFGFF